MADQASTWLEVVIHVERDAGEALLAQIGSLGPPVPGVAVLDPRDWLRAVGQPPAGGGDLDTLTVTVYLPAPDGDGGSVPADLARAVERVRGLGLGEVTEPVTRLTRDEDWSETWKAYYQPQRFGRLLVTPSWIHPTELPGDRVLRLDPGMAFGTGEHATTRLVMEALVARLAPGRPIPARAADVGTGSGILAIAAALLGVGLVRAVDIDPVAVRVARENARANGVTVEVLTGGPDALAGFDADLVLANLTSDLLTELADDLAHLAHPGAELLASGIVESSLPAVVETLERVGWRTRATRVREGWALVEAKLGAGADLRSGGTT